MRRDISGWWLGEGKHTPPPYVLRDGDNFCWARIWGKHRPPVIEQGIGHYTSDEVVEVMWNNSGGETSEPLKRAQGKIVDDRIDWFNYDENGQLSKQRNAWWPRS